MIREAKVAAGGVGSVPWKLPAVEYGARPLPHKRSKVELLQRTVERQLRIIGGTK
ncbi:hypothetical protein [Streptomyces sp. NBC_01604]|uniref:hypothetical protein n=1 Tax=unclassified Streptomyces TaxID=2593676 RepID=UPI003866B174